MIRWEEVCVRKAVASEGCTVTAFKVTLQRGLVRRLSEKAPTSFIKGNPGICWISESLSSSTQVCLLKFLANVPKVVPRNKLFNNR